MVRHPPQYLSSELPDSMMTDIRATTTTSSVDVRAPTFDSPDHGAAPDPDELVIHSYRESPGQACPLLLPVPAHAPAPALSPPPCIAAGVGSSLGAPTHFADPPHRPSLCIERIELREVFLDDRCALELHRGGEQLVLDCPRVRDETNALWHLGLGVGFGSVPSP